MAPLLLLVFSVLSHVVILQYAVEGRNDTSCPPYYCNKVVRSIGFPFTNKTHSPECGLYTVDCSNRDHPMIQLKEEGHWYVFENISQQNIVSIKDEKLQERLKGDHICDDTFLDMLSLPSASPFARVSVQNLTLLRCNDSTLDEGSYTEQCRSAHHTYYTAPNSSLWNNPPPQCSIIQLAVVVDRPPPYGLSDLTAEFSLQVQVDLICYKCYEKGGICQNDEGKFKCADVKEKKKNLGLKLGLGIGLGGPAFLVACFLVLWSYKQKLVSSNLISRNISSQPYSKSDLEGGGTYFGVSVFTYEELEEATNHFDSEKELGDGGFGTVYYGKLKDGREVAVKRLYEHNYKRVEQFTNEIEILTLLRHKNLVSLYGCTSRRSRELLLVYEYIPNGTVADHLHGDLADRGLLTWPIRMSIALETANALTYLHVSDIVHRDVKTTNILLDNNFCVKVADFGLSRLFPLDVTHVSTAPQGTPGYVDPEYHQCYQLSTKSDVYSFGVVLIELISSMPAVDITRHRHEINLSNIAMDKIPRGLYSELVHPCLGFESDHEVKRMTIAVAELAFQCLQQDNNARPTMREVLETLQMIQSGKDVPENLNEGFDDVEMKSVQPPPSPECDELELLKNIKTPPSPISVTQNWPSNNSSTANASS